MNSRLIAAKIINAVTNGVSLADALPKELEKIPDSRDRAFVQAIVYGVCRYYDRLDILVSQLLQKPMREKDSDVHALLLVGLYQLIEMRVPEHAAVSETVNASQKLNKPWARGFINAILREYLRNKDKFTHMIEQDEEALYSHPAWLVHQIKKAWPDHWQAILTANNEHPPFSLRAINMDEIENWAKKRSEMTTTRMQETQSGIILSPAVNVEELPGFATGDVSVQDGAAQLAAELLQLQPGQHVLDACAAPGGKLMHILQAEPALSSVMAVEKEEARIDSINENLQRIGFIKSSSLKKQTSWMPARGENRLGWHDEFSVICRQADLSKELNWWDEQPFDRILLDAPCSASGVIRRHPDIKILRQPGDIAVLAKEQTKILTSLWQTLKPGGLLLYVTCSIFPEENVAIMQRFLQTHADAQEDKIDAAWGIACAVGRQVLPGMHHMDGFYFARLKKTSS